MGENSNIEWTDHTFNPWRGCTKVSPGCANCYAERGSKRNPAILGEWGDDGTRIIASESMWKQPEKWNREAADVGERRRVFCASLADVFEDRPDLVAPRMRLWRLIEDTPHLDWLLLTKRPQNILRMWPKVVVHDSSQPRGERWMPLYEIGQPGNVWIGTSVEDQKTANERIPELLQVPAAVRFLSMEPLLGPVNLTRLVQDEVYSTDCLRGRVYESTRYDDCEPAINWVIVGGESGPNARPMHPEWVWSVRDQCQDAGVPFFFKQWGEWYPIETKCDRVICDIEPPNQTYRIHEVNDQEFGRFGKSHAGRLLNGREWSEFPKVAHIQ